MGRGAETRSIGVILCSFKVARVPAIPVGPEAAVDVGIQGLNPAVKNRKPVTSSTEIVGIPASSKPWYPQLTRFRVIVPGPTKKPSWSCLNTYKCTLHLFVLLFKFQQSFLKASGYNWCSCVNSCFQNISCVVVVDRHVLLGNGGPESSQSRYSEPLPGFQPGGGKASQLSASLGKPANKPGEG